jgi:hypothetical protein
LNIPAQRLHNQQIAAHRFAAPGDVVATLGAVQAQDYSGALWSVALRTTGAVRADVEQALADRTIVRTWPLRGTLHFVAAADVRWMLKHLAAQVAERTSWSFRHFALDGKVFGRSVRLLVKALERGRQLTRDAIYRQLETGGIKTANGRGLYILWRAAHDGVICFGTPEGRQQTFALLDEWVPATKMLDRDAALAELARRYFTSHGPATRQDFAWWSGLAAADARAALDMARPHLAHETAAGQTYWLDPSLPVRRRATAAYLLPLYDEYTVGYRDRSAVIPAQYASQAGNGIFKPPIVVDGQIVGSWTRTIEKNGVVVAPRPFAKLRADQARAVEKAAARYRAFAISRK